VQCKVKPLSLIEATDSDGGDRGMAIVSAVNTEIFLLTVENVGDRRHAIANGHRNAMPITYLK